MAKRRVLLTGASGSMGGEAFKELLRRRDNFDVVLLLRPDRREKSQFSQYENQEGFKVVWGDLCDPDCVLEAVNGVDCVLHPAAFIAPAADHNPRLASRVNLGGTQNIIQAIRRQPHDGNDVRLVYVGSVAAYGDRLPPVHMVKVGDPLKPSVGDYYATTKIAAERAVIESGLKHWVSLRQTYIAIPDALSLLDPILFHQPLNTRIELITKEDAGYGLVQTLEAPDEFYGRVYNMGGGPSCRVVYGDYLARMMRIFGMGDCRRIMRSNWFTLRNFHCCWYEDSWVLNEYLGHWRHSLEDHYRQVEAATPSYLKWAAGAAPAFVVRTFMRRMADPLKWLRSDDKDKIKAFFGSREAWQRVPGWDDCAPSEAAEEVEHHRPTVAREVTAGSMKELAESRGGKCLSTEVGEIGAKLVWRCAFGHQWEATAACVQSGHWCPVCAPPPWDYDAIARVDPLLGRFYYSNHDKNESQKVDYLFAPHR